MERKDVEQKLQEAAEEIKTPEFEELWANIQPRIEKESKKKSSVVFYKALAPIVCCLVAICMALPFILPKDDNEPTPPPVYYLNEDLTLENTTEADFLTSLQSSSMSIVDLSRFKNETCVLYTVDDGVVKGGSANFLDSQESPTCVINLKFYAEDVKVSDSHYENFDLNYTTQSGAVVEYKYDSSFGKYYIKANYKAVQYFMEYVGAKETATQFFETFFE